MELIRTRLFRIAAAVILGMTFIFWIVSSIVGMMQGVPREINNIIMVVIMAVIGVLAWKRTLLGGILLAIYAILVSIYFLLYNDFLKTALIGMVLFCAPVVIAGFLFVEADWTSKQRN
jgi:hypothetical protein